MDCDAMTGASQWRAGNGQDEHAGLMEWLPRLAVRWHACLVLNRPIAGAMQTNGHRQLAERFDARRDVKIEHMRHHHRICHACTAPQRHSRGATLLADA